MTLLFLGIAIGLILLNGFFVAAEFSLVKVRISRIEQLANEGKYAERKDAEMGIRPDPPEDE